MELTNMILDNLKGEALDQIAQSVGVNPTTAKAIASQALPVLMKQLEQTGSDEQKVNRLNKALDEHTGESKIDVADGKKILKHLFDGDSSSVIDDVARATEKSSQDSEGILGALSSVLLETLGDQKKASGGFDTRDLTKILSGIGKDNEILSMVMDQDGDGDFDKKDVMKLGMSQFKKRFLKK